MAAGQPQSYGSIREFLDNLPNQPCIWQPENANICVTCLRINEPVARVCSVWAQALEEAPLEEIDFEEEVRSLPSVVEVEDEFEIIEAAPAVVASPVAEIDIVETSSDWDLSIESFEAVAAEAIVAEPAEEVAEAIVAEPAEEVAEAIVAEEVAEAIVAEPAEEVAEAIVAEPAEEVAEAIVAEPAEEVAEAIVAEPAEEVAEAIVAEPAEEVTEAIVAQEDIILETVESAVNAENMAKSEVEAITIEGEEAAEAVVEAIEAESEAIEAYADAVKDESNAAEAVVEAVSAEAEAMELVVEAAEEVSNLLDNDAKEEKIQEAVTNLEEAVSNKEKAEELVTASIEDEETAALNVEVTSAKEEEATEELEKAIVAEDVASEKLDEAIQKEELAEAEVNETVTVATSSEEADDNDAEPFSVGENVSHGVYGDGKVLSLTKAGKHWSVEVDFDEGKRRILGTFLISSGGETSDEEIDEDSFKRPEAVIAEPTEEVAEANEGPDYGEYAPGTRVSHEIFGIGEIKECEPKGENYRLMVKFEDGTFKTLLSTFVDKEDNEEVVEAVVAEPAEEVAEAIVAEPAEEVAEAIVAEPAEEVAEAIVVEPAEEVAEAIVAEPAEEVAEAIVAGSVISEVDIVDDHSIYSRPKNKKEAVIDLSKPEVQDAEMVDDEK